MQWRISDWVGCWGAAALPRVGRVAPEASPLWSHLHVLLSSAGLAMVGVAGAAGLLYVIHHRSIKRKRGVVFGPAMPSLEALDRVNALAVTLGFLLLGLGLLTGMAWVNAAQGELWPGGFGHGSRATQFGTLDE